MFKNIRNKHLKYIYKIRNFILSLKKKKKKNCIENWNLLDSYQILKAVENQELMNVVTKDPRLFK